MSPLTPAQQAIVEEYIGLVAPMARKFARRVPQTFSWQDLAQSGYLALMEAASTWDVERGSFEMWATFRIGFAMRDHVKRRAWREASAEQLPEDYDPAGDAPDEAALIGQTEQTIRSAIDRLSLRERYVIEQYFWRELSHDAIGRKLGLSGGMVRVIKSQALARIGEELRSAGAVADTRPAVLRMFLARVEEARQQADDGDALLPQAA